MCPRLDKSSLVGTVVHFVAHAFDVETRLELDLLKQGDLHTTLTVISRKGTVHRSPPGEEFLILFTGVRLRHRSKRFDLLDECAQPFLEILHPTRVVLEKYFNLRSGCEPPARYIMAIRNAYPDRLFFVTL